MDDEKHLFKIQQCQNVLVDGKPCLAKITDKEECSKCSLRKSPYQGADSKKKIVVVISDKEQCPPELPDENLPTGRSSYAPQQQYRDSTKVTFHAILHQSAVKGCHGQALLLQFQNDEPVMCTNEGKTKDGHIIYRRDLNLPKSVLGQYYTYVLLNSQFPDDLKNEVRNVDEKRRLDVCVSKHGDSVDVYDGVVRFSKSLWGGNTDFKEDIKLATDIFLGQITEIRSEEAIQKVQQVTSSLREQNWKCGITKEFNDIMKKVVNKKYVNVLNPTRQEKREHVFLNSVAMICLLQKELIALNSGEKRRLSEIMLPEIIQGSEEYLEIKHISEAFPNMTEDVSMALVHLVQDLIQIPGCIQWIFCMPLVHLLNEICSPWVPVPYAVNHEDFIPTWWGLRIRENIYLDLKHVKEKPIERDTLKNVCRKLKSLLAMDYYVSRMLMASLNLDQISEVVKMLSIPPEVIFATLCFHMKDRGINMTENKFCQSIRSCLFHAVVKEPECRFKSI